MSWGKSWGEIKDCLEAQDAHLIDWRKADSTREAYVCNGGGRRSKLGRGLSSQSGTRNVTLVTLWLHCDKLALSGRRHYPKEAHCDTC